MQREALGYVYLPACAAEAAKRSRSSTNRRRTEDDVEQLDARVVDRAAAPAAEAVPALLGMHVDVQRRDAILVQRTI